MGDSPTIPTTIAKSVSPIEISPRRVANEFKRLLELGAQIRAAGTARKQPSLLFENRLGPKHKIELFETKFYLTEVRQIPELRFFVAYIVQADNKGKLSVFPRIIYKDLSLAWRSASHFTYENDGELWVGKGDVQFVTRNGHEMVESIESTTDLPTEIQSGLEKLLAVTKAKNGSEQILEWVLRQGPSDRVEPFSDFVRPRRQAASNRRNLINRGRSIARFTRPNDPSSLKIKTGFEPDFDQGIVEKSKTHSTLYGGQLRRFRILSTNRKIQYYFIAGPKQVWIIPPQATTTELSSYGVRTIDVIADENLFIPGYEYHHLHETETGTELYSQIPPGFAGEQCLFDEAKADASPWLDKIPVIIEFRQRVLGRA